MSSKAFEDYLKIIYKLEETNVGSEKGVSTSAIAERLDISMASVTNMLKKLAAQDLIRYEPYYGVSLKEAGQKIAINMIRRHRVLELYLVERLHYAWDEVDTEAEVLEHAVSDKLIEKMWLDLGCPLRDPHGSPIPDAEGKIAVDIHPSLLDLKAGQEVKVKRIKNRSPEELRYLASIGIQQNTQLKLIDYAPFNGPVSITVADSTFALDRRLAGSIMVDPVEER